MAFRDKVYNAVATRAGLSVDLAKRSVDAAVDIMKSKLPTNTATVLDAVLNSDNGVLTPDQLTALGAGILAAEAASTPEVAQAAAVVTKTAQAAAAVEQVAEAVVLVSGQDTPGPSALVPDVAKPAAPVAVSAQPVVPEPAAPAAVAEVLAVQPLAVQKAADTVATSVSLWQRFLNYWKH